MKCKGLRALRPVQVAPRGSVQKVGVSWKIEAGELVMDVEIPCNSVATIQVPKGKTVEVGSGKYHFQSGW